MAIRSVSRAAKAQSRSRPKATRPHGRSRRSFPSTVEELAAASGMGLSTIQSLLGGELYDKFPGDTTIDPAGATLARGMLQELEGVNDDSSAAADDSFLANWPRKGRPFRNVVAEYAARARAVSPAALEAFYAVLSDFISFTCQGSVPDGSCYDRFCRRSPRQRGRNRAMAGRGGRS